MKPEPLTESLVVIKRITVAQLKVAETLAEYNEAVDAAWVIYNNVPAELRQGVKPPADRG